eukprot:Skav218283  [mRNA]  locus=scaffold2035:589603:594139:- [translate_table: standard]
MFSLGEPVALLGFVGLRGAWRTPKQLPDPAEFQHSGYPPPTSVAAAPSRRAMSKFGSVKTWNDDKGFGFIGPEDGGEDLFCHTSALRGCKGLGKGDKVRFDAEFDDRKGKMRAVNVSLEGGGGGGGGGDRRDDRRDDRRGRDYDRRDDRRDYDRRAPPAVMTGGMIVVVVARARAAREPWLVRASGFQQSPITMHLSMHSYCKRGGDRFGGDNRGDDISNGGNRHLTARELFMRPSGTGEWGVNLGGPLMSPPRNAELNLG